MRQALHIFRKDVRGLAYEIVVALLLVAVFAMADSRPYFVSGPQFSRADSPWWTGFLRPLMLLSWWFLAAKVVQADAIPGDRQFWITRPYSWKSLLAAKVAFLVAFISIPMMISDAVILHGQGFPVLANASGILWEMLLRFSVIVLSSMIVASLTRSLGSFTIVSLVVALAIVFNAGFQAGLGADRWADWTFAAIGEALIPTAIVFQYSRRRKIAVVLAVCAWILPIAVADIERHFWHPMPVVKSSGPELKFKLDSRPARAFTELSPSEVRVVLPIEILGIPKDLRPWSNAMSVTLVSPSSEVWMSSNNVFLLPGSDLKSFWVEIRVPKDFYDGATEQRGNVAVHMFSDLTLYRNLHSTTIRDREFAVPQFGYCEEISGPPSWRPRLLQCRAALGRPTAVVVDSPNNDYEARRFLAEFGISPIVSFAATFNPEDKELVTGEPVSRILQPYDLPPIRLEDYAVTQK